MTNTGKYIITGVVSAVVSACVSGYIFYKRGYGDGFIKGAEAATTPSEKVNEPERIVEEPVKKEVIEHVNDTFVDIDNEDHISNVQEYLDSCDEGEFEQSLVEAKILGKMYDSQFRTMEEVQDLQKRLHTPEDREEALEEMQDFLDDNPGIIDNDIPEIDIETAPDLAPDGDILDNDDDYPHDADAPYVISESTYTDTMWVPGWEKIAVTYCTEDGLVVDDDENLMDDINKWIGEDNLYWFAQTAKDVIFIRNEEMHVDYEIQKWRGTAVEYTGNEKWRDWKPSPTRAYI